jgi:ABC-2 type transport system ATP-binding protein
MELILDNVSKTLKKSLIIDHVSLHLSGGQVYGLQGYNGSGKTMLMRLMAGLLHPTSGRVILDGKVLGEDMDFPPSVGLFLENPAFLPNYTGVENLSLIGSLRGVVDQAGIRASIARVGLDPDDTRKYRKYSLGMKHRLGIACAIFEAPELLLLDEPTNALDKDGVELVSQIIRQERERGALVVLASHEQQRLEALSDVIYTIEHGRIVSQQTVGGTK